jgi:hypothetical protein
MPKHDINMASAEKARPPHVEFLAGVTIASIAAATYPDDGTGHSIDMFRLSIDLVRRVALIDHQL